MLKAGYIRHTVHKLTFSEQCYYVFGDIYSQGNSSLSKHFSLVYGRIPVTQ